MRLQDIMIIASITFTFTCYILSTSTPFTLGKMKYIKFICSAMAFILFVFITLFETSMTGKIEVAGTIFSIIWGVYTIIVAYQTFND